MTVSLPPLSLRWPSLDLHPATRLILWLLLLLFVQCLQGEALGLAIALALALPPAVLRRGGRLVWRTRWLLISLFVVFSWGIAGAPLWSGAAAPTREGLTEALAHSGRLILVLMLVAAFLEEMPVADLLSATHFIFRPLQRFGFDTDRGVVRLMLVLRYVEDLPRPRDWRSLLVVPQGIETEMLELDLPALRFRDVAAVFVALLFVSYFCFS